MGAWIYYAAVFVVSVLASTYAARQQRYRQREKETEAPTLDVPTAEVGHPIPMLFGTQRIRNTNVVWYGDYEHKVVKG